LNIIAFSAIVVCFLSLNAQHHLAFQNCVLLLIAAVADGDKKPTAIKKKKVQTAFSCVVLLSLYAFLLTVDTLILEIIL
jgi:hypothetical protein